MLTPIERRTLRLGTTRHTVFICAGFSVMVVGGLYGIWGMGQLDPERAPDPAAGFDRPIARLALLVDSPQELAGVKAESELEKKLLERLIFAEDVLARLVVALIRLLLSTSFVSIGLGTLMWGLSARSFSRILSRLIESGELVPAGIESAGAGLPIGAQRS